MSRTARAVRLSLLGLVACGVVVRADTLILRNGRRIEGQLVGFRNGVVEFRENRDWRVASLLTFDRDEIRRIELDEDDDENDDSWDSGRDRDDRSGQTGRSGLRERDLTVSAEVAWTDTGIDVRNGQTVYFEAEGRVTWGPGRRDGPAGERRSPSNAGRPMPNRPGGALIGRIGADSTDCFFIGEETGPVRMRDRGRLYLGINDDYLVDNSGSFRVSVRY